MMVRRLIPILSLCAAAFVVGCGGNGTDSSLAPDPIVMWVNVSPDSSPIDFFVDGELKANNRTYLATPEPFASIEPGDSDCTIAPDGGDEAWSEAVGLNRDESYIIASFGLQNYGTENLKRMRIAILRTDRTGQNNSARIFIFHAYNRAQGFQTPALDFQNPGNNPQYRKDGILFGNRVDLIVDAGSYTFVARRSGTESEVTPQITKNFESGKIYLAVITGVEGATGAQAPKIEFFDIPPKN